MTTSQIADSRTDDRVCVVVLGARSGTSALAGTLGLLGGKLPRNLLGATSSNQKGHFEPWDIARLHDSLLAEIGSVWHDWRPIPSAWYDTPACAAHMDLLQAAFIYDYDDFTLAILKEPPMCRLLPLWWRLLDRVDARPAPILAYRDPFEVAQSLQARDGSTMMHGLLYWLRNQLDAELFTRGMRRSFVLFDDLLRDWSGVIDRIEADLPIHFPARSHEHHDAVNAFLEPSLRHQHRQAPCPGNLDEVAEMAVHVFELFHALRTNPGDSRSLRELADRRQFLETYIGNQP